MAGTTDDVDGTAGLHAAAFSECPECDRHPVAFVTVADTDADVLNTHVAAEYAACHTTVDGARRVVMHERDRPVGDASGE